MKQVKQVKQVKEVAHSLCITPTPERGFSLVELSIVLVIVGLLVSTMVTPLSSSIRQAQFKQTSNHLNTIRDALNGYLINAGRLPCPVSIGAISTAVMPVDAPCVLQHGAVPAIELGVVGERSANGALLDAWDREYRYSVSMTDHNTLGEPNAADWLTVGEPAAVGAGNLSAELQLCRVAANRDCPKKDLIANQIVWVVYSLGETDKLKGLEVENRDNDTVFTVSGYSSNEEQPFDDQIIWASRSELVYWLLKANWLP